MSSATSIKRVTRKGSQSEGTPSTQPLSINVKRGNVYKISRPPTLSGDGPAPLLERGPGSKGSGSANQTSAIE